MVSSRYSEQEIKQWHDASCQQADASRVTSMRRATAKGQGDASMNRSARTATPSKASSADDWARECLFDCYNS